MLSILGMIMGPILVLLSSSLLFWNEGRAVQTERSLSEGLRIVVAADPSRIDPAHDGKLVHVSGEVRAATSLRDAEFGLEIKGLRLVRTVEMYQWKEDRTHGGTPDYYLTWANGRIDSGTFSRRDGHENPSPRFTKASFVARDASLASMMPGEDALARLPANHIIRLDQRFSEPLQKRINVPVQIVDGRLYVGADPGRPNIGDLRISFSLAPEGPASFVGRQDGARLSAYQTHSGDRILLARAGIIDASAMFADAEHQNVVMTWLFRLSGLLFMIVGFNILLLPLRAFSSWIPLIGGLLQLALTLVAGALTAVVGSVIIASAWLWYRPLISAAILVAGLCVAAVLKLRAGTGQPPPLPNAPATAVSKA